MKTVILVAAILGQCSGGRCPAPTRFAPSFSPSVTIAPAPIRIVERPEPLTRLKVNHDGMVIEVLGTMLPNGNIRWNPDLSFNAKAVAVAVAARLERRPTARAVPKPVDPPAPKEEAKAEIQNFGIAPDLMGKGPEEYRAASIEARQFVSEAKGEAGEATRLHVTVIGTEAECDTVVKDLKSHPSMADVRDHLMIQDYRPSEWPVDPKLGFQTTGKPTILIQTARSASDPKGGRVVYRQMDYSGGPERLAEEIRKADPKYNPNLDPGPGKPNQGGCPLGFTNDHWLPIVGACLVVFFIFARPKVQP